MIKKYPRDMVGYGQKQPKVEWPNNAKLALQIVLNYEEDLKIVFCTEIKHLKSFYLKLLEHNLSKEDI